MRDPDSTTSSFSIANMLDNARAQKPHEFHELCGLLGPDLICGLCHRVIGDLERVLEHARSIHHATRVALRDGIAYPD
jgi:hypothetical protein